MGYLFAALTALLWGLAAIPVKLARFPARLGVMASMGVATVALGMLLVVSGQMNALGAVVNEVSTRDWALIVLVGVLRFGVGVGCYFAAVRHAGVSTAAPILSLATILVVVTSVVLGMSPPSLLLILAAVVASMGGMILGLGLKQQRTPSNRHELHKGVMYALLACLLIAAGHLMIAEVNPNLPSGLVTWFALLLGSIGYLVILGFSGQLGRLKRIPLREVEIGRASCRERV